MNFEKEEVAYIVSSCDKYHDLWNLHFEALSTHFSYSNIDKFVITNFKDSGISNVINLQVGEDLSWSHMMQKALDMVNHKYVILSLDDFVLRKKTDCHKLSTAFSILRSNHEIGAVRLIPRPKSDLYVEYPGFNLVDRNKPYSLSLQATIWKKDYLRSLLIPGESPWEFELSDKGSRINKKIITSDSDILGYKHHCVERGHFFPWDKYFFKRKYKSSIIRRTMPLRHLFIWLSKKLLQILKN